MRSHHAKEPFSATLRIQVGTDDFNAVLGNMAYVRPKKHWIT